MMDHAIVALTTTAGIAFLFLIYFLWRRLRLDIFRDHLFHLRERWFDLALDSRSTIQFDSPLYRSVEQSLYGMLQFAPRLVLIYCTGTGRRTYPEYRNGR